MSICCPIDPDSSSCSGEKSVWGYVRVGVAVLVSGQSMALSLAVNDAPPEDEARYILHGFLALVVVAVFLLAGLPMAKEAWRQLRAGKIVVEQLFLTGVFGAFFASLHSSLTGHGAIYYEVVAVLMAIYSFGQLINERKRSEAVSACDTLRKEFESCTLLSEDGRETLVPVREIKASDRVMVRAGEGVPVDGVIEVGVAFIRETPLTGEPFPVVRREGDRVWAGSVVIDHTLVLRAETSGETRKLDRLLRQVELARAHPAQCQRQADRVVAWFLPLVLILAVVTFGVWTYRQGWITGLFNGLAVLVVACPCAMGLATPIAIWNALGALAKKGVLAFSGEWIERVAEVDTVVFDKTGTLSEGELVLVDFAVSAKVDRENLQRWISAVQGQSSHPVAKAFSSWTDGGKVSVESWGVIPGVGVEAVIKDDGRTYNFQLGNASLLNESDKLEERSIGESIAASCQFSHRVFAKVDGKLVGIAILRERFRESLASTLDWLESNRVEVEVLTGDRPESVQGLGWEKVSSGLSPEEKAAHVRFLQSSGKKVLFVGDGINDSPAIAEAHASLAMSEGAGVAKESAQAILYGGDLSAVAAALVVSRRATDSIKGNLRFAIVYNFIGIGLAAFGIITPVVAAVLMFASSLLVTWRALKIGEKIREISHQDLTASKMKKDTANNSKRIADSSKHKWAALVFGVSLGLQGPVIAWMSGMGHGGYFLLGGIMVLIGTSLTYYLARNPVANYIGYYAGMISTGGLGMLLGWTADAGFAPVVSHGACMCGCAKSMLVKGVADYLSGMNIGMLLGSIPPLFLLLPESIRERGRGWGNWLLHAVLCLGGMVLGMEMVGMISGQIKGLAPQKHFFLSLTGMTLGMLVGMIAGCVLYIFIAQFLHKTLAKPKNLSRETSFLPENRK